MVMCHQVVLSMRMHKIFPTSLLPSFLCFWNSVFSWASVTDTNEFFFSFYFAWGFHFCDSWWIWNFFFKLWTGCWAVVWKMALSAAIKPWNCQLHFAISDSTTPTGHIMTSVIGVRTLISICQLFIILQFTCTVMALI